jgi:hypothetical protein
MSGPKVVRIVTREELVERCNGMLARVDAALAEWIRVGQRNGCLDDEAIAAARDRRAALAGLIVADRFLDFQKQAPMEESFLRGDIDARLAQIATERAAARSRERRQSEAGRSLVRTLHAREVQIAPELEDSLRRGEPEAIAAGFRLLAERSSVASASRDLAAKLQGEGSPKSFAEWLAARPSVDTDKTIERLEMRIAELSSFVSEKTAGAWRARLDEATTAERARRGLLLDGLEVETGRALTEARSRASAATDLDLLLAELEVAGLDTAQLRAGVDTLDASDLAARAAAAKTALESHRAAKAALGRRAAVLKELSALGYELAEGMDTASVQEGRLVLRNATRPDYGVEVSAAGTGERLQMRAVAFDTPAGSPDPARDRDAETIWCGDVSTLQDRLAKIGGALAIEKALPIGATPLKRIMLETGTQAATAAPAPKKQTLR